MKRAFLYAAVLACSGSLMFSSCKKDDDNNNDSSARKKMIVGTWKAEFDADDDNDNKILDESEKVSDDSYSYIFREDGTASFDSDFIDFDFTWSLQNNDQDIVMNIFGSIDTTHIHTLTDSKFIIEYHDDPYNWEGLKK